MYDTLKVRFFILITYIKTSSECSIFTLDSMSKVFFVIGFKMK